MSIPRAAQQAISALEALASIPAGGEADSVQREVLSAWTGWGPLAPALGVLVDERWQDTADRLEALLSPEAFTWAQDVCDTSYFTPTVVGEAVFDLLRRSGFTGGRVLEPGVGSGALITAAPADWAIDWTGIDADPTAARIAQLLHPDATIIAKPLQDQQFPSGSFDAVIGNVPFSKSGVYDPNFSVHKRPSLHTYFTVRALDAVKPGGYLVLITSRYFLDSIDDIADTVFGGLADLMAAVRLPSGAFDGTEVVADILVLRRREDPRISGGVLPMEMVQRSVRSYARYGDTSTTEMLVQRRSEVPHEVREFSVTVSSLWEDHPALIAGRMEPTGYLPAPLKVRTDDVAGSIRAAVHAAKALYSPEDQRPVDSLPGLPEIALCDAEGRKEGSFHLIDDVVHQVVGGSLRATTKASKELRALIALRDAAVALIELESDTALADAKIAPQRAATLALYEAYVSSFGAIGRGNLTEGKPDPDTGAPSYTWRRPLMGGFRKDPDYLTVLAIEHFDQDTGEACPAPILLRRVNFAPVPVTSTDSPAEAVHLATDRSGVVDIDHVASLLGTDIPGAEEATAGLVFTDPVRQELVTAGEYLSGNVRVKLAAAEAAGADANMEALRAVLPAQLGPLDIRPQLGAPWISADIIRTFIGDVLKMNPSVSYIPELAVWEVGKSYGGDLQSRTEFGTPDIEPVKLLELALNGAVPVLSDEVFVDGRWKKVKNSTKSLAAEQKQLAIQQRFEVWLWEEKDRADQVCNEFNRRFRSHRPRRGDGQHLSFPGLSTSIELWPHQKDAVQRIITDQRTILHHPVGAGKTLEAIVGAVKLKQLGLAQKPLITVPNHLLEQIAREARTAYPTGRFLIAGRDEVTKENKRLFAARCATGDWDAVIMTHTAFASIPVSAELESRWVEERKAELRDAMSSIEQYSKGQKKVAAAVRRLESQLMELRDDARRDEHTITFEQLGVDHVSVDEFHMFRRLMVTSNSQSGFSLGHSKRATDLLLKVRSLTDRHPGKPVFAGFTGTLISNTLAEVFVWQSYVQPERLQEAGVSNFDAWAATFVRFETAVEVKPTGQGFHMRRRPRAIRNAPELYAMLSENCDRVTAEQINLERPTHETHDVVSQPSDVQQDIVESLAYRADRIYAGGVDPREDNMLAICGTGRAVALDPRLLHADGGSPKMSDATARITKHYLQNRGRAFPGSAVPGMFQLVFCDLGTPKPGDTSTYGRLRAELIAGGIPAAMIRFVHEATTDKARAALFAQCRSGEVAVLIGSTAKMGMGTNIQTRLGALHHLDAPWLPSDLEQRNGRALRPKNHCPHVDIYRYVTEGTFDALTWETLHRKELSIGRFLNAGDVERDIDDVTEAALSYGQVKALATGRPELLRHAEISAELQKLRLMRSVWAQQVNAAHSGIATLNGYADGGERRLERLAEATGRDRNRRDETDLLATDVVEAARKKLTGSFYSPRRSCDGLSLSLKSSSLSGFEVTVEHEYLNLHSFALTRKEIRRGPRHVAKLIRSTVQNFSDDLPEMMKRLSSDIVEYRRRADESRRFVETAVFDREAELSELVAERARLESEMAQSAEPAHLEAVAA
ncbi:helicase-related protein [Leucobacter sp. cx-169]|uniref:helicase-related protein n=1 Tax=Leucobacter sp. cx-169 TaxID=2770549 RepID=UPI00165DC2C8|nr:helicase-related protein [Leucobacter sp. cx-169]MBC9927255.1 hypothetical protein [Leucobacter sp. cx-169]